MNSIQSFILKNDTDIAINYLSKFAHLMRLILTNSRETYISLKDELSAIRYYMDLEKLRFDDRFDYVINIDPNLDEEFTELPPMILQPYIENSIIHGFQQKRKKGKIEINITFDREYLLCSIIDNGIGRAQANLLRQESGIKRPPKGMLITQKRLEMLNNQSRQDFSVLISDLKDSQGRAKGTKVDLKFEYKEI